MLPLKEKDKPLVQKLLSSGCCPRCVLRFCCINVQSLYKIPPQELLKELKEFIGHGEISVGETIENKSQSDADAEQEADEAPPPKRFKPEETEPMREEESPVCPVCLGVLQEHCDQTLASKVAEAIKTENYEFDSLVLSVSLPAQLCVREHSCWLHVKTEVRAKSLVLGKDDVIQVKEAFKWNMQSLVSKTLGGAAVVSKSAFEVGVEFVHPDTDKDCHFLATTCSDCFKPTKNKESVFTRMAVVKALEKISDTNFLKHYPCPPPRHSSSCVSRDVQCLHTSVFIAGRYNKFCRSLPQTPWLINGERRMESSVEELIAGPILETFRATGFNFSSSGREDVDVRTLGNGRPFAMELINPHKPKFNRDQIKKIQQEINDSSDKIRVRDLQIVSREAMGRMKEGEEEKTKSYRALVWTEKPIEKEDISFLNDIKELTLDQKTPLRVLHRRALAVRPRVIHSMSSEYRDTHHFYLELKTQAGTYIKEFVHGDFGRTKPNMCQLLQTETDILELDVESVDVDWPPPIPE
ncbi:putative tRNA pseudouridine synthase Pus10 [Periophthalmus magnuspinnatus]|uniref:putative tRNA pseudouridine synthase Pus10 n=1 Tax=Periophthalmus magnuspinnatus TaxID=409849 RepID=UPI00145AD7AD|nr:putative tRNA pseudouridine synthase Pus10 [Periophthalmus magnuspinnatus]